MAQSNQRVTAKTTVHDHDGSNKAPIPKELCRKFNIRHGDEVFWKEEDGYIRMEPALD